MAKKAEETGLAVTGANPLAMPVPAHIAKGRGDTFKTVDATDVLFTRLTLMQDKSPLVESKQYQSGDLVNKSIEQVVYRRGAAAVRFIIAAYFKEYVEFGDRNQPLQPIVIQRSTDRNSELAKEAKSWVKKKLADGKEVKKVTDVHNFIILIDGRPNEPLLLSCAKSNNKHGTSLLALSSGRGDVPMYAGVFTLITEVEKNRKGETYNALRFRNPTDEPWATEEMYTQAKKWNEFFMASLNSGNLAGVYEEDDAKDTEGAAAAAVADKDM